MQEHVHPCQASRDGGNGCARVEPTPKKSKGCREIPESTGRFELIAGCCLLLCCVVEEINHASEGDCS